METSRRTLVKGLTWQLLGLVTVTLIAYAQSGDWRGGIAVALSACTSGFIFFYIHERIWSRISWGKHMLNTDHKH